MEKKINKRETNSFASALGKLLNATADKITRRELALMLSVSEPAISQWLNGITFPEASKINTLISIYEEYDLDDYEQSCFNQLLVTLELPINDVWEKAPIKLKGFKISDYLIKDKEYDIERSISNIYFDLKKELLNQSSKIITKHIDYLIKSIPDDTENYNKSDEDTFYDKVIRIQSLGDFYKDPDNIKYLKKYTSFVTNFHSVTTELYTYLIGTFKEQWINDEIDFDDCISFFNNKRKSNPPKTIMIGAGASDLIKPNYDYTLWRYSPDFPYGRFVDEFNYNKLLDTGLTDHLYKKVYTGMMLNWAQKLLNIKGTSSNSFKIGFLYFNQVDKELLNIEISKYSTRKLNKINFDDTKIHCLFNHEYDNGRISNMIFYKNNNDKKNLKILSKEDPLYSMTFGLGQSEDVQYKTGHHLHEKLEHIFKLPNSKKRIRQNYIIEPTHNQPCYSVQILNIENKTELIEPADGKCIVILIMGEIDVKTRNEKEPTHRLTSLLDNKTEFNTSTDLPPYIYPLQNNNKYRIQSNKGNSIALLLQEHTTQTQEDFFR